MDRSEFYLKYKEASDRERQEKTKEAIRHSIELGIRDGIPDNYPNIVIAIEELSELQQQLTKCLRGKIDKISLIEEMADVLVSMEYVKEIYNITDADIIKAVNVKIDRMIEIDSKNYND